MEEVIKIKTKRKKPLKPLLSMLGKLGFTRIEYSPDMLLIEKIESEDLKGKPFLFYRAELSRAGITVKYTSPSMRTKLMRNLDMGIMLLNLFLLLEDYYDVQVPSVYMFYFPLLKSLSESVEREKLEMSSQLAELQSRHDSIEKRYKDLLRSSEQNARILVEYERKNEELKEKISKLEGLTDEVLQERVFQWIKDHDGEIDLFEFSKINSMPVGRVEEGLDLLIKNGYIRKR